MNRKRFAPEATVNMLREADVLTPRGMQGSSLAFMSQSATIAVSTIL